MGFEWKLLTLWAHGYRISFQEVRSEGGVERVELKSQRRKEGFVRQGQDITAKVIF